MGNCTEIVCHTYGMAYLQINNSRFMHSAVFSNLTIKLHIVSVRYILHVLQHYYSSINPVSCKKERTNVRFTCIELWTILSGIMHLYCEWNENPYPSLFILFVQINT